MSVFASKTRTLPLVAVLYRVPLFVEALAAAFDGIADVQPLRADDAGLAGLLAALHPDAVVVEHAVASPTIDGVPMLHVDLATGRVHVLRGGTWLEIQVELSPEAIRNAIVAVMTEGGV